MQRVGQKPPFAVQPKPAWKVTLSHAIWAVCKPLERRIAFLNSYFNVMQQQQQQQRHHQPTW
jgi:hypothetical protein